MRYRHNGGAQGHSIDHRKQSLYLPKEIIAEVMAEADRQDRSVSWLMTQAWRMAREQLSRLPAAA